MPFTDGCRRPNRGFKPQSHHLERQAGLPQTLGLLQHIWDVNETATAHIALLLQKTHQTVKEMSAEIGRASCRERV